MCILVANYHEYVQRYENLDETDEEVDMNTLTDREYSSEDNDSEYESREDTVIEDNKDDSDSSTDASDCIELLSGDEKEFVKTFKEVVILRYK